MSMRAGRGGTLAEKLGGRPGWWWDPRVRAPWTAVGFACDGHGLNEA